MMIASMESKGSCNTNSINFKFSHFHILVAIYEMSIKSYHMVAGQLIRGQLFLASS